MKVYIGCFGSGLGHATRMLAIADILRGRGDEVEFSSSGEVASFIETRGYRCNKLPLADVAYSEEGALSLRRTMLQSPSTLGRTCLQVGMELSNVERFRPDVVLSDSAVSTVVAARLAGVRVCAVLNQLNLSARKENMGAAALLLSEGLSAGMAKLWGLCDRILLPDLPPPYTISESSLRRPMYSRAHFVGFLTDASETIPDEATMAFSSDRRPRVFWQISGPPLTRGPLVRKAREIASQLAGEFSFVLTFGNPKGGHRPKRFSGGWEYEWCESSSLLLESCDVVVSRAGHGTIANSILSSKPSLLTPIHGQTEQEGNAAKAVRLGIALSVGLSDLSPEAAREALNELLTEDYKERSRHLGAIARGYDARSEIVRIIDGRA